MQSAQLFNTAGADSHSRVRELLLRAAGSPVLVLGAGVTGRTVAQLLARGGYRVTLLDEKSVAASVRVEYEALGIAVLDHFDVAKYHARDFEGKHSLAVLSPGIALNSPLVSFIVRASIPCLSEIDLAVAYLGMPTVAVTGTNGKTTTVHLIFEMIARSGIGSALVGNVGTPMTSLIDPGEFSGSSAGRRPPLLVAEVSSYQLEAAFDFVPHIGVCLNIDDDHLERHGTIDEYVRIKSRIFSGQTPGRDWSLICLDDPWATKIRSLSKGRYLPFGKFSAERDGEPLGCWYRAADKTLELKLEGVRETYYLDKWRLLGDHNLGNLAAAVAAARLVGATVPAVQNVIDTFCPLPHRLEFVAEINGVSFINDSKGTNVSATKVAIETLRDSSPIFSCILLVGGKAKKGEWKPLARALLPGTRAVIGFGADGEYALGQLGLVTGPPRDEMARGIIQRIEAYRVNDLGQAVAKASSIARTGDCVLLSPACSSFDAYRDYAERGEHFRALVRDIAK